jgi:hypothetical protein
MMFMEADSASSGDGGDAGTGDLSGASLLAGDAGIGDDSEAGNTPGAEWNWTDSTGAFSEGWADKLPEDLKSGLPTLAKYKSLPDLMKAHVHLQSTLGKKANAVSLPGEKSTPEEIAEFRKAFGVPDAADKYSVMPERLPDGVDVRPELLKPVLEAAHKHNVPEAAMRDIMATYIANQEIQAQEAVAAAQQANEQARSELQAEYKGDFDKKIRLATLAAKSVGIDPASPGFADPEVVKAMVRLGEKMSDDSWIAGEGSPSLMPGKLRASEIMGNPKDAMYDDYHGKNGVDRQQNAAKVVADMLRNG